ncbi:ribosomal RNA-processing protein 8 [Selaginella moellendorffii]|nr:ribosomal RNA-processing protein 8 [Selaginella moellendorffii]|eukprot:XP_002979584.2 ribosomal RNA-processing protein 8 [Selaginella moellendorffii]
MKRKRENGDSGKKAKENGGAAHQVSGICDGLEKRQHSGRKDSQKKSTSVLDKMRQRLSGGQFRMLNEVLYTRSGEGAKDYFDKDPDAFKLYHAGYQEQMSRWPKLPVDVIIEWLNSRNSNLVVADFGCGDARLAKSVKNKVFSFDLVSNDPVVTACNMASTPIPSSSVDVAVFCLSLMGTDYPSYLKEAHRVLKAKGWLLIAEVKSRFDPANHGADPQVFLRGLKSLGFSLVKQDDSNKMFLLFYLRKDKDDRSSSKKLSWPELKPCLYKKR